MEPTTKNFFAVHKTKIMIACASIVIGANAASFASRQLANAETTAPANSTQQTQQPNPQQQQQVNYNNHAPQNAPTANYNDYAEDETYYGDEANYQGNYNNAGGNVNYANYGGAYSNYAGGAANYSNNSGADYTSGYWAQQKSNDRTAENFSDYIRDQGNYSDGYGNTYKLNSGYDNNYVNTTTGEYTQSNDVNYDPNAYSTSSWTAVTPTTSSSSYSSSGDE
jgi:hypothetical protein